MVNKSTIITQNIKQKNKKTYHTDGTFPKSNRTMMVNKSTIIKQKNKTKREQKKQKQKTKNKNRTKSNKQKNKK
jgi:hypothetical protein